MATTRMPKAIGRRRFNQIPRAKSCPSCSGRTLGRQAGWLLYTEAHTGKVWGWPAGYLRGAVRRRGIPTDPRCLGCLRSDTSYVIPA